MTQGGHHYDKEPLVHLIMPFRTPQGHWVLTRRRVWFINKPNVSQYSLLGPYTGCKCG